MVVRLPVGKDKLGLYDLSVASDSVPGQLRVVPDCRSVPWYLRDMYNAEIIIFCTLVLLRQINMNDPVLKTVCTMVHKI